MMSSALTHGANQVNNPCGNIGAGYKKQRFNRKGKKMGSKFTSFDGVDNQGVRAEVKVETGEGKIKEINGRGTKNDDGTYPIVEVVIDPENEGLKFKIYGLLNTSDRNRELVAYIKKAYADQTAISYRTESQRKRKVDR
jgi:hypothetical protein